jgi:large subunit ribosomal protein L18
MDKVKEKNIKRLQRKRHVRKRISGTADRPRMSVYRSNKNISVQVIDDVTGRTLVSASSLEKEIDGVKSNIAGGDKLGQIIGDRLKEAKITSVVFDRNGYLYHGVVKAIADGARKAGIKF